MKKMWTYVITLLLALWSAGVWACPALSDLMDAHYGKNAWSMRTAPGTGTDIAPAIYAGVQAGGEVCIGRGLWALRTPLDPAIISGASIRGVSSQASVVYFSPPGGTGAAFWFSGAGGRTGGGLHGLAILLEDGYGMSSAIAVKLQGDAVRQPDQMMLSDLYITSQGDSFWFSGFFADGQARTSPQGLRVASVSNLQVFKSHGVGVWLAGVVQWTLSNVGVYVGAGAGNNLYIAGGGTPSTNSTQVYLTGAAVMGEINITNVTGWSVSGTCSRIATMANASNGVLAVRCPVVGVFGPGVSRI